MKKFGLLLCYILLFYSDSNGQRFLMNKKKQANIFFNQYTYLLEKSLAFINRDENKPFVDSLNSFVKNQPQYHSHTKFWETVVCQPILFNTTCDKALILVLKRIDVQEGCRFDDVLIINANKVGSVWSFKSKSGVTLGSVYYPNITRYSDQENILRILRNLINEGYLYQKTCAVDDNFWNKRNSVFINSVQ